MHRRKKSRSIRFWTKISGWSVFILLGGVFTYFEGAFVCEYTPIIIEGTSQDMEGTIAYVINLDRSVKRREFIMSQVMQLGFSTERVSAVDGKLLSEEEIKQKVDLDSYNAFLGHTPELGMIGCNMSHFSVWEAFLHSCYRYALVIEDDVSFNSEELRTIVSELTQTSDDWDIVSFELSHKGMPLTVRRIKENNKLVVYLTEVTHTGAYLINRKAASRLWAHALPIKMPIDAMLTRGWEFGLKFTGIEPRLVHQVFGDSEIGKTTYASTQDSSISVILRIRKIVYKAKSYTMRFLYNLKLYFQLRSSSSNN
ncbi:MAG: glycosyltransferase family 25 protein [Holosporales bacterium]|nr:glycosyltransferase family 25 protein [Holosporales bacterium]